MGIDNPSLLYLIDFGLAKKYRSSRTFQHIKYLENKHFTGNIRYASINALKRVEQSRRDDLEAIGYVLLYFLRKGELPWQGLKVDTKEERLKKTYEKKESVTLEDLCNGFPKEFVDFINYTRKLEFEEEPDYTYLRGLLETILKENGLENDGQFDWMEDNSPTVVY